MEEKAVFNAECQMFQGGKKKMKTKKKWLVFPAHSLVILKKARLRRVNRTQVNHMTQENHNLEKYGSE